ncbi:MAG TPA: 2-hydroxyglutaryl-CoA dehydratase [Candidatus Atribacteria bacterium]|nr:2-hydroxyglutaryl-CoA dehydratase [Candidatus Atribacteria bacterium]
MSEFLGVDVGSISTNLALINEKGEVRSQVYLRTQGQPIEAIKKGMEEMRQNISLDSVQIRGVGTTGSGRVLAGTIVGADIIKNEITSQAVATLQINPQVRTIFEIGGQDSKIIILQNGIVVDFGMNTICAAGTGSFLDQQAYRLKIPIEKFGDYALQSTNSVRIAGRCTVFAESDMIHKQQLGYEKKDIIAGLCEALVRNYLNNVAKGKKICPPIFFQGGVASNPGIRKSFEKELGVKISVPEHHKVMGAIGAALLAKEEFENTGKETSFRGFNLVDKEYRTKGFECDGCPNRCEVVEIFIENELVARWGDRCGKWSLTYGQIVT